MKLKRKYSKNLLAEIEYRYQDLKDLSTFLYILLLPVYIAGLIMFMPEDDFALFVTRCEKFKCW